jgi:predicted RNA polymerase sigma factor
VRLLEQNRALWDRLAIYRGLVALDRATRLGGAGSRYVLEASISACHARATRPEDTDWERIAAVYAELGQLTPSPIVELNRAMAVAMAQGPQAGLDILEGLMQEPSLASYHLLPAAHGDLLERLGRFEAAGAELTRAAQLTHNARERELLMERAASCAAQAAGTG